MDLLVERRMNYTFPMNKTDLLLTSGFSIMWQSLDLEDDSKLVKDNQKSLTLLLTLLNTENQAAATELRKMAQCVVTIEGQAVPSPAVSPATSSRASPAMAAPTDAKSKSTRKQLQAIASKWSTFSNKGKADDVPRRSTVPQTNSATRSPAHRASSTVSLSSTRSAPVLPMNTTDPNQLTATHSIDTSAINLDYLPLGDEFGDSHTRTSSSTMLPPRKQQNSNLVDASWDQLLNNFDSNQGLYPDMNIGGQALYQPTSNDWVPDAWNLSPMDFNSKVNVPQSLLSFSEESLTSGDDFLFSAPPSNNGSTAPGETFDIADRYRGITIPVDDEFDFHEVEA